MTEPLSTAQPVNNAVILIASGGQQRNSAMHIHVSILPQTLLPYDIHFYYYLIKEGGKKKTKPVDSTCDKVPHSSILTDGRKEKKG